MNVRLLTAAAALGVAPLAANADGLPPAPAPAPAAGYCCAYVPVPDWTGFYAGLQLGGVWSVRHWSFPFAESFNTLAGQSFSHSGDGAIFGGQIGINYQINHILVGAELTGAWTGLDDTRIGILRVLPLNRFNISSGDLFTLTGRLGYVYDRFLLYGKAGYANAGVDVSAVSATGISASANQRENGWTVGAGLEMRLYSNLLFGVEYNFIDLSGDRFTSVTAGTIANLPFHADISDIHTQTVLARLSVLFGPNACCHEGLFGKY
jgi:outer membrane immunogenic protein